MKSTSRSFRPKHLAGCMAAALGIAATAHADTVVTHCADDGDAASLRAVLTAATSGDIVDASQCATITLSLGELSVAGKSLTVHGPAVGTTTIDAAHLGRAFNASGAGRVLVLDHLLIIGGRYGTSGTTSAGACIRADYKVDVRNSVVTDCIATSDGAAARGGAIDAAYTKLKNSTVSNSKAQTFATDPAEAMGGGVAATTRFDCSTSTVAGNAALAPDNTKAYGGGVLVNGGTVNVEGCTISGNTSSGDGGGISQINGTYGFFLFSSTVSGNSASVGVCGVATATTAYSFVSSSTIAYNSGPSCGGLLVAGKLSLVSSIVALNSSNNANCVDVSADQVTGGDSLLSVATSSIVSATIAHPRLTPLADRGGPTQTHGLSRNSLAIDIGFADGEGFDQRGFPRSVGVAADIGAFELQLDDDELFYGSFQ